MSARSAVTRISKSERTSWFTEDSTERNDCQSTAAATPVCFAWWKIRSKEFTALRTARSAPSCRGFVPLSLRYNFLMCQYRDKEAPKLTESGFQFLLMDTNAQLWYIIREYISNSEQSRNKGPSTKLNSRRNRKIRKITNPLIHMHLKTEICPSWSKPSFD
ncbi:hypothetical protein glysoja_007837 [Glycine soja]|nr:hypothetical protein glysoja_007837 [Glycine soja]